MRLGSSLTDANQFSHPVHTQINTPFRLRKLLELTSILAAMHGEYQLQPARIDSLCIAELISKC